MVGRWLGPCLVAGMLAHVAPARAMCVRSSYEVLAWNPDGSAVLLVHRQGGPEGGGSLGYLVVELAANRGREFWVSSDFSPGDGSTPQGVPADACRANVTAAGALLKSLRFSARLADVATHCGKVRAVGLATHNEELHEVKGDLVANVSSALKIPPGRTVTAASADGHRMVLVEDSPGCAARCSMVVKNARTGAWARQNACVTGPGD